MLGSDRISMDTSKEKKHEFTLKEIEYLIELGTLAGSPSIIMEAVKSWNIFDPAHMERARAMNDEWERGERILQNLGNIPMGDGI